MFTVSWKKIALRIKTKTKSQAHKRIGIAKSNRRHRYHPAKEGKENRPPLRDDPGIKEKLRRKISRSDVASG